MNARWITFGTVAMLGASLLATEAYAQSRVSYGRITAVRQVNIENQGSQAAGTLVGGALGAMSGSSGRSRSNRALRGVAGANIGRAVAGSASGTVGFEYTVLIGNQTIRMVTEQAGLRVGDCVSVEQGALNNIRLADDASCAAGASVPAAAQQEADACTAAKQQLIDAVSDADFDRAERRVRLLCGD